MRFEVRGQLLEWEDDGEYVLVWTDDKLFGDRLAVEATKVPAAALEEQRIPVGLPEGPMRRSLPR